MRVEVDIPDVMIGAIRPERHLIKIARNGGPSSYLGFALLENLVRVTENASLEYSEGKAAVLLLWHKERRESLDLGSALRASTHFEACLTYTHRALRHVATARRPETYPNSRSKLPPALSIYGSALVDRVKDLRRLIEHKEDRLLRAEISPGEPFAAYATGDEVPTADNNTLMTISRIELGPFGIEFSVLSTAIDELRTFAEVVVDSEYELEAS